MLRRLPSLLLALIGCIGARADDSFRQAHPILEHDLEKPPRAQIETFAREIMALPDAEVLALVPVQTPFITSDCPACGNTHYARGLERALWKFALPDRLTCVKCNETFPSEKFPLNEKATFLNTRGEKVEIAFHRDANGRRFALPGALQSWQNGWLVQRLEALGKLYQLTKDERYARRVALVLDRYAEVFPHYLVKDFLTETLHDPRIRHTQRNSYVYVSTGGPFMRDGRKIAERPQEPEASTQATKLPYGWTQSRWGWGRWGNDIPSDLLRICDLVYRSREFEKLSHELGHDVRRRITDDLFGNAVAFVQEFPFYYHLHNNASSHVGDMIRAGRVLGRPEWVRFGYRWSREVLEQYAFCRDGAFAESPGYLYVFLATQEENFNALIGYSDPPGFVGKDGVRLQNLGADGPLAFLQKARVATESIRFPNGSSLPLGDNRHDEFVEPLYRPGARGTPLERSQNVLLPGYGHAVLGDGAGDRQVQAHLQFSSFRGVIHTHMDGLSLMLWAFGSEVFTDSGYHKTKYRGYATTTLSHNTVVMNRVPQSGDSPKGSVLMYEPNLPGLSLVQVEDRGAYQDMASRYRRTLLLNTRHLEAPYLVDVFEVTGGHTHDYALHGPTIFDSTAETDLPLTAMPGERPLLAPGETWNNDTAKCAYGAFTNVRRGPANASFAVTFKLVNPYERPAFHPNDRYKAGASFHYAINPASYRDQQEIGVRTHFVADAMDRQIFLAESPSLLRSGLGGSDLTEKLKRPSLLLRRQGSDGLKSVFVAIHEPFYGQPKITAVKPLKTSGASVALQIESAQGADVVLLSLEGPQMVRTETASMNGCLALISTPRAGKPAAFLIGGTELAHGALRVNAPAGQYHGKIESVASRAAGDARNTFVTSAKLPAGDSLRGTWIHLHFEAQNQTGVTEVFEIDRVAVENGQTQIDLKDDPGLTMKDGVTTERYFPRRKFAGEVRFTIHTRVASGN